MRTTALFLALLTTPSGASPRPLWRWEPEAFPLVVIMSDVDPAWRPDLERAVVWWNRELDREVFLPVNELEDGGDGIVVVTVLAEPKGKLGTTSKSGTGAQAIVRLVPHAEVDYPTRTAAHELGHVLGLHHTGDTGGVMHHQILGGAWSVSDVERTLVIRACFGPLAR